LVGLVFRRIDRDRAPSSHVLRLLWAAIGAAALGVLVLARWLQPHPSGVGTHMQLGLPACGFLRLTELPCPTCGLTTSFAHMARLQFTPALHAHWLGPLSFALTVVVAVVCAWGFATAMPAAPLMKRLRLWRLLAIIAAGALAAWMVRVAVILSA
jgi:hypothetical protein